MKKILQIVPRPTAGRDGVGDYARTLAHRLEQSHGWRTTFASATSAAGIAPLTGGAPLEEHEATILHYVNYGYDPRGVPRWLPPALRSLASSKLLTVFHELYASGSWRQSAFWLRPIQKQIARSIARMSGVAIVSSEVLREQLARLTTETRILVHPVFSNFGEPNFSPTEIATRDPHRWVICGGTELVERSLRSFTLAAKVIGETFAPRELFVVGGADHPSMRRLLQEQVRLQTHYHPEIEVAAASAILSTCGFGWVDYFTHPGVPMSAILKSTAFAACAAHGVIPVFPHGGSTIGLSGDALPGPFFVAPEAQNLPAESDRGSVAEKIHRWYQRNASSEHLAQAVAAALSHAAG